MTVAWALPISSTDKLVLLALADWSNDDGACWPSMRQLADKSGLTDRAIRTSIGRLVEAGHLTRSENPGKGVYYTVHPGTSFRPEDASPRKVVPKTPERRSSNTPVTITSPKASPSSRVRARKPASPHHRMPEDWKPIRFADSTMARSIVDRRGREWAQAALESFRSWAANADDKPGAGRKLDWQQAWAKWIIEQDKRDGQRKSVGSATGASRSGYGRTVDAAQRFLAAG